MTMTADWGDGVTMVNVIRFADKDTQNWSLVARDRDGKVLLDMEVTGTEFRA